ncbi:MAG: hypothetical protein H6619_07030 [Deltaproteobacteria bacterium]|nr:hypothetical protein [Deltaproteobacteria bacterium]
MYRNFFAQLLITILICANTYSQDLPDEFLYDVTLMASGCCKVCKTTKACGDSCIIKTYTCHKGSGCACNSGSTGSDIIDTTDDKKNDKKSKQDSNKEKTNDNKEIVVVKNSPKDKLVKCPKIIARKDTKTYSKKKNFECFNKRAKAEDQGYLEEPIVISEEISSIKSSKKRKCPNFIGDKRTDLYVPKAIVECFKKSKHAIAAGYISE